MAADQERTSTLRSPEDDVAATERTPMRATPLSPGMIVAGKYEVVRLLGAGGMGAVFAARHVELGQLAAIKVLQGDDIVEHDIARFLREGRTAARLSSEHAVRIYDIDRLPSGLPFLVMEHLEGEDLGRVLLSKGPISVELAVTCIVQACAAIQEAHGLGIVHRDLKPQNLFLVRGPDDAPRIKVLDFGIAKIVRPDVISASLAGTTDGTLLGSPHFMSPEQIRSARAVDARTDIWALGATLYKLLTGAPPFMASSVQRVLVEILSSTPAPVRAKRREVSEELERVVARCLEKSPEARFPSAEALATALRSAIAPAPPKPAAKHALAETLDEVRPVTAPMAAVPLPTPAPPEPAESLQPRTMVMPVVKPTPIPPAMPAPAPLVRSAPPPPAQPAPHFESLPPAVPTTPVLVWVLGAIAGVIIVVSVIVFALAAR